MAVKNTNLGGSDWSTVDDLTATDLNDTFDALYAQLLAISPYKWSKILNAHTYADFERYDNKIGTANGTSYDSAKWTPSENGSPSDGSGTRITSTTYQNLGDTLRLSRSYTGSPTTSAKSASLIASSITVNKPFVFVYTAPTVSANTAAYAELKFDSTVVSRFYSTPEKQYLIILPYEEGRYMTIGFGEGTLVSFLSGYGTGAEGVVVPTLRLVDTVTPTITVTRHHANGAGTPQAFNVDVNLAETGYFGMGDL